MKLTSSNFAAAMGLSPYQSRQKLWRVLTGRENRDPLNANMQWGIDHERDAVAAVEGVMGRIFDHTGSSQRHWVVDVNGLELGTTPDGITGAIGLEVKCPQKLTDEPPAHYLPQVQGQIHIAGLNAGLFAQWTPDETRVWGVSKSDEYISEMLELLKDFARHIYTDEPPKRRKKPVMPPLTIERIK